MTLMGIAALLITFTPINMAYDRMETLRVQGYSITEETSDTRVGPTASAIYFGPPVADIKQAVTAPGLRLEVYEPSPDIKLRIQRDGPGAVETVAWGEFDGDCRLYIMRLHEPVPSYWMSRTAKQSAALHAGEIDAYQFTVVCGQG
ncbi:hypothetical protein [Nocardia salmonicida]|uniref:hypothetical protein n=1 Tax=Nocardia salmonicida TaxID=53431 RepID=UPI0036367810